MLYLSLLFFFLCSSLHAEKIIQCIAYYPVDVEPYNRFLKEKGYDAKMVVISVKEYEQSLLKRKGWLHKALRKVDLDYPWKVSIPDHVDKIVFFNVHPNVCKKYDLSRFPKEKLILFMWEPRTILKKMYSSKIQRCFSKIYTWDDSLVDGVTYFKFNYPVFTPLIADSIPFEEKKLCTLISSDLKGHGRNELYSQRKEAINYFEQVGEKGFEFYGRRWDPALYSSYLGEVDDKLQVMKNYRFCICYENTKAVSGYITEKIFDCFAAGVVPVYWGADNVDCYIPPGCFIDRRDFESLEKLHAFLKGMRKEEYLNYLEQIKLFLEGPAAQEFTFERMGQYFYEAITQ